MSNKEDDDFRSLLVRMATSHETYAEKLQAYRDQGLSMTTDSIEEIIDREKKAAEGLRRSIALLDRGLSHP